MTKSLRIWMVVASLLLGVSALATSAALASQAPALSDQILGDYRNSKTFQDFIERLTKTSIPGDFQYVQATWKENPELTKNHSLPKLIFENKQYTFREGMTEFHIQPLDESPYGFAINGENFTYSKYDLAEVRMERIHALTTHKKSTYFSLLVPSAWAEGQLSKMDLAIFALTSTISDARFEAGDPDIYAMKNQAIQDVVSLSHGRISQHCATEFQRVGRLLVEEISPSAKLSCEGSTLYIPLAGTDSNQRTLGLRVERNGFAVVVKDPSELTYRFKSQYPNGSGAGIGSPAQRDHLFVPADHESAAHQGYADRFDGVVSDSGAREFCGSCSKDLAEYNNLLKQANAHKSSTSAKGKN